MNAIIAIIMILEISDRVIIIAHLDALARAVARLCTASGFLIPGVEDLNVLLGTFRRAITL
jgi:hypothetical protein